MKPTYPAGRAARHRDESRPFGNHHNYAPITDWSFQPTNPEIRGNGGSASFREPSFHTLSDEFFAVEAKKESRLEGAVFAVIVALAAWPMALAAQAAYALLK
jgi:outer membrane cobalamin receptor